MFDKNGTYCAIPRDDTGEGLKDRIGFHAIKWVFLSQ